MAENASLHKSFGDVDSSPLQGLEFFEGKPHFSLHKESALVSAEQEMAEQTEGGQHKTVFDSPAVHHDKK